MIIGDCLLPEDLPLIMENRSSTRQKRRRYQKDLSHNDDIITLINLVRDNPALYNYKLQPNLRRRSDILQGWAEIATKIGNKYTVEECRRKWKNLRDTYHQYRLRKPKVGESLSKWRYAKEMEFLSNVYQPKLKSLRGQQLNINENHNQNHDLMTAAVNDNEIEHGLHLHHHHHHHQEEEEEDGNEDNDELKVHNHHHHHDHCQVNVSEDIVNSGNIITVNETDTFILTAYDEVSQDDEVSNEEHTMVAPGELSHHHEHGSSNLEICMDIVKHEQHNSLDNESNHHDGGGGGEVDYEDVCLYEEAGNPPAVDCDTIMTSGSNSNGDHHHHPNHHQHHQQQQHHHHQHQHQHHSNQQEQQQQQQHHHQHHHHTNEPKFEYITANDFCISTLNPVVTRCTQFSNVNNNSNNGVGGGVMGTGTTNTSAASIKLKTLSPMSMATANIDVSTAPSTITIPADNVHTTLSNSTAPPPPELSLTSAATVHLQSINELPPVACIPNNISPVTNTTPLSAASSSSTSSSSNCSNISKQPNMDISNGGSVLQTSPQQQHQHQQQQHTSIITFPPSTAATLCTNGGGGGVPPGVGAGTAMAMAANSLYYGQQRDECDLFFDFLKKKIQSFPAREITAIQVEFLNCVLRHEADYAQRLHNSTSNTNTTNISNEEGGLGTLTTNSLNP